MCKPTARPQRFFLRAARGHSRRAAARVRVKGEGERFRMAGLKEIGGARFGAFGSDRPCSRSARACPRGGARNRATSECLVVDSSTRRKWTCWLRICFCIVFASRGGQSLDGHAPQMGVDAATSRGTLSGIEPKTSRRVLAVCQRLYRTRRDALLSRKNNVILQAASRARTHQ